MVKADEYKPILCEIAHMFLNSHQLSFVWFVITGRLRVETFGGLDATGHNSHKLLTNESQRGPGGSSFGHIVPCTRKLPTPGQILLHRCFLLAKNEPISDCGHCQRRNIGLVK